MSKIVLYRAFKFQIKKFKLKHGKEFILTYNPHLIALGSIYNNVINSDLVIVGSDLTDGFEIIYNWFRFLKKLNHEINAYIIMPNHVHVIITFNGEKNDINKIDENISKIKSILNIVIWNLKLK